jgi:hypothetical protein
VTEDLAQIGREFPGWHPWRSSAGRWWATRRGPVNLSYQDPDLHMTIDADDAAGLREALRHQETLRASRCGPDMRRS